MGRGLSMFRNTGAGTMNDPATRTGMDRWPSDVGPRTGTATGKAEFRWRRPTDAKDVTRSGRRGSWKSRRSASTGRRRAPSCRGVGARIGYDRPTEPKPNMGHRFPFPGFSFSGKRKRRFQKTEDEFPKNGNPHSERPVPPTRPTGRTRDIERRKRMGFKAFPHRLIVRIGDEAYRKLRQESRKAGYQVALVERWFLIP